MGQCVSNADSKMAAHGGLVDAREIIIAEEASVAEASCELDAQRLTSKSLSVVNTARHGEYELSGKDYESYDEKHLSVMRKKRKALTTNRHSSYSVTASTRKASTDYSTCNPGTAAAGDAKYQKTLPGRSQFAPHSNRSRRSTMSSEVVHSREYFLIEAGISAVAKHSEAAVQQICDGFLQQKQERGDNEYQLALADVAKILFQQNFQELGRFYLEMLLGIKQKASHEAILKNIQNFELKKQHM